MNITVVIHGRNVEKSIAECILSAKLLTENVVVVDAGSSDLTSTIARKLDTTVYRHSPTDYVEPARTFDIQKAAGPWVFILDPDERMTPELAQELKDIISKPVEHSSYRIPRKNIFSQRQWLRHGGWWPDYVSGRLLYKPDFVEWPVEIHSKPIMKGTEGTIHQSFLHYFHSNLENMVVSTIIYEKIESGLLYKAGRPVRVLTLFRKFLGELFRRLIQKAGFMDGTLGIIESIYQAYSKTMTWIFLYEKSNNL